MAAPAAAAAGAAQQQRVWTGTILGGRPILDANLKVLSDFMFHNVTGLAVELELRLGVMTSRKSGDRAAPTGVTTPTPLAKHDLKFVPGVSKTAFESLIAALTAAGLKGVTTKTKDIYYAGNVRQTVGPSGLDGAWGPCVKKDRLADLDFVVPAMAYDFRVSASREEDCPARDDMETIRTHREKTRTSFHTPHWTVDMTIVHQSKEKIYEVELELATRNQFKEKREACRDGRPDGFLDYAISALQNILSFIRTATSADALAAKAAAAKMILAPPPPPPVAAAAAAAAPVPSTTNADEKAPVKTAPPPKVGVQLAAITGLVPGVIAAAAAAPDDPVWGTFNAAPDQIGGSP